MQKRIGKICFVIPYVGGGGAERVVSILTSELAEQGYDITLIKYYKCENEYPVSSKVKTAIMAEKGEEEYRNLKYSSRIIRLRRILVAEKPDYVVPFLPHVARHVFFATLGMRCRIVQTTRVAPWLSPSSKGMRLFRDFLIACSYSTFVQTESQKGYFPKSVQRKIAVIPNPVSNEMIEASWHETEKLSRIMVAGRLSAQKNFPLAIDAVHMLRQDGYEVELNIFGDGDKYAELQNYIDSLGASEYCHLRGRSNNIITEYCSNHIFFLSSDFEGMPNALLEALAVGMPCVSTDCETGPADLLGNDRGILIPVNDVQQAYCALKKMMNDRTAAVEMGKKAKEFMKNYYSPQAISKIFIEKVIERKR